jgi:polyisoprenoid-binding protein YceI
MSTCPRLRPLALTLLLAILGLPAYSQSIRLSTEGGATTAEFSIDERLFGSPKTVIGTNVEVTGAALVDPGADQWLRFQPFEVRAAGFTTDSNPRNRQIRGRILNAADFEYIRFVPRRMIELTTAADGRASFQLVGSLTIREVTRSVEFAMEVELTPTAARPNALVGVGSTKINLADFQLTVPRVFFVAEVAEEMTLAINLDLRS